MKTVLRFEFAEAFRPWLELRDLLRVVGDEPSAEIQGAPIVVDRREKKQRVIAQVRALKLEQEGISSAAESIESVLGLVVRINEASKLPSIRQMRYDSIFIEPYALPFHELVDLLKDRFFRPNPIVDTATDVGLTLDQHETDAVKHFQVGPMESEQLRSTFLIWPRNKLPEQFVFVSLGYEQIREIEYDTDYMRGFLETAERWQSEQVEGILGYLRQQGG